MKLCSFPSLANRRPYDRLFSPKAAVLLLALAAGGCRDDQVGSYRIPKESEAPAEHAAAGNEAAQSAAPAPAGEMAATPVAVAGGTSLTWTAPSAWTPKLLGAMRKGSFTITGPADTTADLSITAFPGAVGGEWANINRWRGQLSLPPIAESELASASTRMAVDGLTFTLVDIVGTGDQPQRILGAMVPVDQSMWFFKLTGPDALVGAEKPAFLSFLKTVQAPDATSRP